MAEVREGYSSLVSAIGDGSEKNLKLLSSSSYNYPENESDHSLLLLVTKRKKSKFLNWGE